MTEPPKPWERQDGETSKAFDAFRTFRDIGPTRTIGQACEILRGPGFGKDMFKTWSSKWKWTSRAAAWDEYLDEQRRKQMEHDMKKMNDRHRDIGKKMQMKAMEKLAVIETREIDAANMVRMMVEAVKIERLGMGLTDKTSQLEIVGKGGGPIQVVDQTPERIAEILAILQDAGAIPGPDIMDAEVIERKQLN